MSAAPLRLTAPEPRAKALDVRPAWWRAAVERETGALREELAQRLDLRGAERRAEALAVIEAFECVTSFDIEASTMPAWLVTTIWRWDAERERSRPRGHRLFYTPLSDFAAAGELDRTIHTTRIYRHEVLREAERRLESRWHKHRAEGHRKRFRRTEQCATETVGIIACKRCGNVPLKNGIVKNFCDSHLLCVECRRRRKRKYRAKFSNARIAALQNVREKHVGKNQVYRDPVIERFVTLTCPHVPNELGGPEKQAEAVARAWSPFAKAIRDLYRRRVIRGVLPARALKCAHFVRCIEATNGRDERGHVHIHAWSLGPFVRAQVMRFVWGRALKRAEFPMQCWPEYAIADKGEVLGELSTAVKGKPDREATAYLKHVAPQQFPYPRVDVQQVRSDGKLEGGEPLARELIKYLTKDLDGKETDAIPVLMSPTIFASVFRGLLGRRMLTASRGFWCRRIVCCEACDAIGTVRLICTAAHRAPERARGPPPLFAVSQRGPLRAGLSATNG